MSDPFRSMPALILTLIAAASLVACGGNDNPPPAPCCGADHDPFEPRRSRQRR